MVNEIYEPAEDSFLMVDVLKEVIDSLEINPKKPLKVLDMGTGSGYIGYAAKDLGCIVTYVDINPYAIELINAKSRHSITYVSDLFFRVPKRIQNIVVFNTPYLPDEPYDETDETAVLVHDISLHGGPTGIEIAIRFLKQINKYIDDDSIILMLVSSLGDIKSLESYLHTHCFSYEVLGSKKLFHEELFVYKIQRLDHSTNLSKEAMTILRSNVPDKYTDVTVFARGKRGLIFKAKLNSETVAIKVPLEGRESVATLEAKHLQTATKLRVGPRLIEGTTKYVAMEFIEGELIGEWLKHATPEEKKRVFDNILQKLELMDRLKFNKFELTNLYKHIIIKKDGEPVMIDFERAKFTSRPKNVNQFKEYIKKHTE